MMDTLEKAIELDISQQYEEAAALYEQAILELDAPLQAYINLACLYWDSIDPGNMMAHHWSAEFLDKSEEQVYSLGDKYPLLETAAKLFGDIPEIEFWTLYFNLITGDGKPFLERCIELVQLPNASLVPYFYLINTTLDPAYLPQIEALYKECWGEMTAKNRYILSMIGSFKVAGEFVIPQWMVDGRKKSKSGLRATLKAFFRFR